MKRPLKLVVLLLVLGLVGCGKSSKPTVPEDPWSSDRWVQVASPGGRSVGSLAVIDTILFAGTGGGVFRSTDNAVSWTPTQTVPPVSDMVASGTSLFVWTTDPGSVDGLFRSTDNGASWVPVMNGLASLDIRGLAVCGTHLFVWARESNGSTDAGRVFRSADDGVSWVRADSGLTDVYSLAAGGTNLFATTFDSSRDTFEVFRSTDDGANWTPVVIGPTAEMVFVYTIAATGNSLLAGALVNEGNLSLGRMYRSTDQGASWMASDNGMYGLDVGALAVRGTSVFAGTSLSGVYRTNNDGADWAPFNTGMPSSLVGISGMAVIGTNLFASSGYFDSRASTWRPALLRRSLE